MRLFCLFLLCMSISLFVSPRLLDNHNSGVLIDRALLRTNGCRYHYESGCCYQISIPITQQNSLFMPSSLRNALSFIHECSTVKMRATNVLLAFLFVCKSVVAAFIKDRFKLAHLRSRTIRFLTWEVCRAVAAAENCIASHTDHTRY